MFLSLVLNIKFIFCFSLLIVRTSNEFMPVETISLSSSSFVKFDFPSNVDDKLSLNVLFNTVNVWLLIANPNGTF